MGVLSRIRDGLFGSPTITQSSRPDIPQWVIDLYSQPIAQMQQQGAPGSAAFNASPLQRVAGFTPDQTAAFESARTAASDARPIIDMARTGTNEFFGFDPVGDQLFRNTGPMAMTALASGLNPGSFSAPTFGDASGAVNDFLSDAPDMERIKRLTDVATRPIFEQLNTEVLPGVRNNAQAAGGLGGSRQRLFEQRAKEKAAQMAADVGVRVADNEAMRADTNRFNAANLVSNLNFAGQELGEQARVNRANEVARTGFGIVDRGVQGQGQRLDAIGAGIGAAGDVINMSTVPGQILSNVGGAIQANDQARLDAGHQRHQEQQALDIERVNQFFNRLNSITGNFSGTTQTVPNPGFMSPAQGLIGLGMIGAGIRNPGMAGGM